MSRRSLEVESAFWPVLLATLSIGVVGRTSFALAAAVLVAIALVWRVLWWMPFALAGALLFLAPALVAAGDGDGANMLASFVVLLAAIGIVLLTGRERKKLRSGEL